MAPRSEKGYPEGFREFWIAFYLTCDLGNLKFNHETQKFEYKAYGCSQTLEPIKMLCFLAGRRGSVFYCFVCEKMQQKDEGNHTDECKATAKNLLLQLMVEQEIARKRDRDDDNESQARVS